MLSFRALIVVGALVAAPAMAQTASADTHSGTTAVKGDPNRMICERVEEIGTRLGGKRVCLTAAQWEAQRQQTRSTLDESRSRAIAGPNN